MSRWLQKTRTSRVGSNLEHHAALAAYDARVTAARRKPLVHARKRLLRDARAFLTKPVVRQGAALMRTRHAALERAVLDANADGRAIDTARTKARRAID